MSTTTKRKHGPAPYFPKKNKGLQVQKVHDDDFVVHEFAGKPVVAGRTYEIVGYATCRPKNLVKGNGEVL